MRILLYAAIWIGATATGTQGATSVPVARQLAIDACSACHQVTPEQRPPPLVFDPDEQVNVAAPAFDAIAAKFRHRPAALRQLILAPRHPMREQNWDPADLTAVITFVRSIKPSVPPSHPGPATP